MKNEREDNFVKVAVFFIAKEKEKKTWKIKKYKKK